MPKIVNGRVEYDMKEALSDWYKSPNSKTTVDQSNSPSRKRIFEKFLELFDALMYYVVDNTGSDAKEVIDASRVALESLREAEKYEDNG